MQSSFLTRTDRSIAYSVIDFMPPWRSATTETIIFHHGVAVDRWIWSDWLPILAGKYRIVIFDMFGCGQSSPSGKTQDWKPEARVADLVALADHIGISKFHLVGESYGGTIALLTAIDHPERINTLTICNASHKGSSIRSVEFWENMIDRDGMAGWARHMMGQRFYPDAIPAEKMDWYLQRQATSSPSSVKNILRELLAVNITDTVSSITHPALLIHGDSSPFVSVELMEDLHGRLPASELHIIGHAKHGLPFSHGQHCANILAAFLERQGNVECS